MNPLGERRMLMTVPNNSQEALDFVDKDLSGKRKLCDYCPQNFSCGRLKSILTIMENNLDAYHATKEEVDRFYQLKSKIESQGWYYPENEAKCSFGDPKLKVNAYIQELIAMYRQMFML